MPTRKTPGVHVEEVTASVAEAETAVPAFIGYSQRAQRTTPGDRILRPTRIRSLEEYERSFGGRHEDVIGITLAGDAAAGFTVTALTVNSQTPGPTYRLPYLLYYAVKMYFDNGGRQCYIVSVGTYREEPSIRLKGNGPGAKRAPETNFGLSDGLDALALEAEPTLIVIPDAVNLDSADYEKLVQAVLKQAGALEDRFALFDVHDGGIDLDASALSTNRGYFGNDNLKYGAAYYPFVRTTMRYYQGRDALVAVTLPDGKTRRLDRLGRSDAAVYSFVKDTLAGRAPGSGPELRYCVVMPPSGAVAGVYAATDTARGVWKAPANVPLAGVAEAVVQLDDSRQERLSIDPTTGKSINAIRTFAGRGTLVWGARTLAGNDNEWRYVSVRRFVSMVEESVKKGISWAVFEANDDVTWSKVRAVIESYLLEKWRVGALVGSTPAQAFFVRCGLGTTMTARDVLDGRMNVEIGMAVIRPADFIILKFSQRLQAP